MQGYAPSSPTERECDVEAPPAMAVIRLLSLLLLMARLLISTSAANTIKLEAPTTYPMMDITISRESTMNVTYVCITDAPNIIVWELNGRQIYEGSQIAMGLSNSDQVFIGSSVFIKMAKSITESILVVTKDGRQRLGTDEIHVRCNAFREADFTISEGDVYRIIQFDPPSTPGRLRLNYLSREQVMLQWERPPNLNKNVNVNYTVEIANLTSGSITEVITTDTSYVINQTAEGRCQPHSFTVTAMNEAGNSNSTTIQESIPISPDVTPITQSQTLEQITLRTNSDPVLTISFEPATNCSTQFPVLNYTVSIEGLEGNLTVDGGSGSNRTLTVALSSTNFPQLTQGQQYNITITACTNFTCRSPDDPLLALTTDVQRASAVFYDKTVSLNCSFAAGSSAGACFFVFTLTNEDRQENVTVSYKAGANTFNTSCVQLSNTRGAFDREVMVYHVESDGSSGTQPITALVSVENDTTDFPCPIPSPSSTTREEISRGVIGGIVVVVVVAFVLLLLLILATGFLWHLKRKVIKTRPSDTTIKWADIVDEVHFVVSKFIGTDGPDGEGLLDVDDSVVDVESFPVAVMLKSGGAGSHAVTVQLLDSHDVKQWAQLWFAGHRPTVALYPQKHKNL